MKKVARIFIVEILPLLFVCLMLYTAISKWKDYNLSREQMALMPLLTPIAHIVVWALPLLEIVIAILVFIPITRLKGLYVFTTLMVIFSVYVGYMMAFYDHLPCSCGGLIESLSWKGHLIFNLLTVLLSSLVILSSKRSISATSISTERYVTR